MSRPKLIPLTDKKFYELVDFLHLESEVGTMKGDTYLST